jgi:hypothetical protein
MRSTANAESRFDEPDGRVLISNGQVSQCFDDRRPAVGGVQLSASCRVALVLLRQPRRKPVDDHPEYIRRDVKRR